MRWQVQKHDAHRSMLSRLDMSAIVEYIDARHARTTFHALVPDTTVTPHEIMARSMAEAAHCTAHAWLAIVEHRSHFVELLHFPGAGACDVRGERAAQVLMSYFEMPDVVRHGRTERL